MSTIECLMNHAGGMCHKESTKHVRINIVKRYIMKKDRYFGIFWSSLQHAPVLKCRAPHAKCVNVFFTWCFFSISALHLVSIIFFLHEGEELISCLCRQWMDVPPGWGPLCHIPPWLWFLELKYEVPGWRSIAQSHSWWGGRSKALLNPSPDQ